MFLSQNVLIILFSSDSLKARRKVCFYYSEQSALRDLEKLFARMTLEYKMKIMEFVVGIAETATSSVVK